MIAERRKHDMSDTIETHEIGWLKIEVKGLKAENVAPAASA